MILQFEERVIGDDQIERVLQHLLPFLSNIHRAHSGVHTYFASMRHELPVDDAGNCRRFVLLTAVQNQLRKVVHVARFVHVENLGERSLAPSV